MATPIYKKNFWEGYLTDAELTKPMLALQATHATCNTLAQISVWLFGY